MIMQMAPMAVFSVNDSPKKITEKIITNARLSLSTGATCEILPDCNALK